MNHNGPSSSVPGLSESPGKCEHCGVTTRLDQGVCLSCLLKEGLEVEGEPSVKVFKSLLREANVPDAQWRLGNYQILEQIGHGGMGVIYRARQRHSRRIVALKRVFTYHSDSHETLARFRREAEAAASLDHPNILPIYEVSETDDGLPFFSMKLAAGGSLRIVGSALHGKPRECVRLMAKVARAIAYAHEHGILHRDLQPGNILLDAQGEPLVSDFGLAKWLDQESDLTQTLTTFGTPGYIAPEQAEGAQFSPAADIYSLGAILFNLLAGRPPFVGANPLSVIRQAAATPAPKLRSLSGSRGVDRDLETIVAHCLERDPKARYESAAALADDLERWLDGRAIVARPVRAPTRVWRWSKRNPVFAGALAVSLLLALSVGWLVRKQFFAPRTPVPEKSIAVLPFENLSVDPDNAFFADGVQDELVTDLARIADLKVISRTSVMAYKSRAARNLHKIGEQLGVAHVMEGSVRRSGDRVRVSVQLIDAKTGSHIWGRNYDATLADSLALQGELATQIAAAVGATLSPQERARVTAKPTNNIAAYDAYMRGRVFASENNDLEKALDSYRKAVALDPNFVLAWARLSSMQSQAHWQLDSDPKRVAAAKAGVDQALALDPHLPEVHLAVGYYRYYVQRDFTGALTELQQAEQALPNDSDIVKTIAFIQRRLGHWEEALRGLRRAIELDPRDIDGYHNLALTYEALRRFPEALATVDRALAWELMDRRSEDLLRMKVDILLATGELQALGSAPGETADMTRFISAGHALLERRYADAQDILSRALANKSVAMSSTDAIENRGTLLVVLGLTQQRAGDLDAARATYQQVLQNARHILEATSPGSSAEAEAHANLGWAYAGLSERESAIAEGQRAMAIIPSSKDLFLGPKYEENMARIYALLGDAEHAIPILKRLLHIPYLVPLTPAKLRTNPTLEGISNDLRFQELIAEATR